MWCIYAALHIVGLGALWAVVLAVICPGSAGSMCLQAIIASGIVSIFVIGSFINAVNRCRAGR